MMSPRWLEPVFSINEETGDLSTLVKLIRVTLLAPIVLVAALFLRKKAEPGDSRPPLMPAFVLAFLILATFNSFGLIPEMVRDMAGQVSRWALLAAIAAVGMKTSIPKTPGSWRPRHLDGGDTDGIPGPVRAWRDLADRLSIHLFLRTISPHIEIEVPGPFPKGGAFLDPMSVKYSCD